MSRSFGFFDGYLRNRARGSFLEIDAEAVSLIVYELSSVEISKGKLPVSRVATFGDENFKMVVESRASEETLVEGCLVVYRRKTPELLHFLTS